MSTPVASSKSLLQGANSRTVNIFIGNLSYSTTEDSIQAFFEEHGEVASVRIITDRETGRSRGFGFVEMPNDDEARNAMASLNGQELDGREVKVSEARKRDDRGGRRPPRRNRW